MVLRSAVDPPFPPPQRGCGQRCGHHLRHSCVTTAPGRGSADAAPRRRVPHRSRDHAGAGSGARRGISRNYAGARAARPRPVARCRNGPGPTIPTTPAVAGRRRQPATGRDAAAGPAGAAASAPPRDGRRGRGAGASPHRASKSLKAGAAGAGLVQAACRCRLIPGFTGRVPSIMIGVPRATPSPLRRTCQMSPQEPDLGALLEPGGVVPGGRLSGWAGTGPRPAGVTRRFGNCVAPAAAAKWRSGGGRGSRRDGPQRQAPPIRRQAWVSSEREPAPRGRPGAPDLPPQPGPRCPPSPRQAHRSPPEAVVHHHHFAPCRRDLSRSIRSCTGIVTDATWATGRRGVKQ